ncbi:putative phage tail protein [Flavonifractor sp. An306]|uniref:putative phage tail protein n=1 Tax=Flavonifractor sp. An306 TaxID=1965629 RepID=UPI0026270E31|nr:putative phage tail protein [Flavonifractor sp. An306]
MSNIQFDTDMLALLPPWYREILDYQQICQTEREQMEALADSIQAVTDNMFFQTMDEASIYLWEQILNIVPNPQTETLGFRQARVISRLSSRPPFTIWFLYQKLDELIGPGRWSVNMDYPNYTLYIKSAAQNQSYATEVAFTVNRIKPAHIVYVNTPYVESGILLSETISMVRRTFNYLLGSWNLGILPFATDYPAPIPNYRLGQWILGRLPFATDYPAPIPNYRLGQWILGRLPFYTDVPQEIIKMPTTPSIQPLLLSGVANFVSGEIVSARINGTISISDLTKSVSGSVLTINFTVPAGDFTAITTVELLDASGNVLTSSNVYVPITGATLLEYRIPVAEGVNSNGQ